MKNTTTFFIILLGGIILKKKKLIGIIIVIVVLVVLVIFASTFKLSDSHLRVEGVRVRVIDGALLVDGCEEDTRNAAYCEKLINVNGEEQSLEFEFLNFRDNGYPDAVRATINGHEFYYEDGLNIEENGSYDYRDFLNFYVIDDIIVFTLTKGTGGRTSTLYAIDLEGNIILEETVIDEDDMLIKDYTDFITFEGNTIRIYATRVVEDVNYHGESVCNAQGEDIVEAYYTYTYEDGEFEKELDEEINADEFIENRGIICANRGDEE